MIPRSASAKIQMSLLYVEDESVTRKVFCEVLSTKVKTVYQAADGKEGLEMFRSYLPDVVLIDNHLPEMDGLALSHAIQSIAPATNIIIVSGDINRSNLCQMEQMKLHYIKKPIRIRELLDLLESLENGMAIPSHLAARGHSVTSR